MLLLERAQLRRKQPQLERMPPTSRGRQVEAVLQAELQLHHAGALPLARLRLQHGHRRPSLQLRGRLPLVTADLEVLNQVVGALSGLPLEQHQVLLLLPVQALRGRAPCRLLLTHPVLYHPPP